MGRNPLTGALEPLDFTHLVENVPELRYIETSIDTYQFTPPIDSSDMSPRLWAQIVRIISERYHLYDGFVRNRHYGLYFFCSILYVREFN